MARAIQLRRGTASEWTSANPTLSSGEVGVETDTSKFKIGDGSTAWTGLAYSSPPDTAIDANILDVKGDLIVATADNTPARLAVGSAGQVLAVNSATATGLEWQTISATPTWESDQNILANQVFS